MEADEPTELSLFEIRKFMLDNGCKITNHALVKHFKKFLTNSDTQNESRKKFKTYVNVLATIKTENNEKFLVLRKKYLNMCPTEEEIEESENPSNLDTSNSKEHSEIFNPKEPPPYKPPPDVVTKNVQVPVLQQQTKDSYRDCITEFQAAVDKLNLHEHNSNSSSSCEKFDKSEKHENNEEFNNDQVERPNVSVKEAARIFNRMASEEETRIMSPTNKNKTEKISDEQKFTSEVTMSHPKAKEWVVSAAKGNYQELAKLAQEYPELTRLQDPTAYTALHWAAKHGNEDIVKLIAGTYKASVDVRTNGGYTPLHIAMQFGRDNIFELLCNVYKANRDILDWSGNKPLDYHKQQTTISASTYTKIREKRKQGEKELGFLRIGSLNVRVRKTTEAFSNFLGVGSGSGNNSTSVQHYHSVNDRKPSLTVTLRESISNDSDFEKIHKNWGSVDNIPSDRNNIMPPPKRSMYSKKGKSKRASDHDSNGYNSMPSTPNQIRAQIGILMEDGSLSKDNIDSDSDIIYGFGSNWSVEYPQNVNTDKKRATYF